jgi:hypothetical protein
MMESQPEHQPVPAPMMESKPERQPVPAPVMERPAPRAPDPAEIERALTQSGLEMVQTRPGAESAPPSEPEFVPAKRERRPPPADLDEPLVQVETGRESTTKS